MAGQGASAVDETSGFELGGGAAAAPNMEVPSTLGGYQMLKELGRGGMGAVYLARQMSLDRNVAVKVMRPEWAKDPIFVARFTREAFAAAQLVHHNVVQIHDIGAERDTNFFSMEFVEGESLGDMVKRDGNLDAEVAVGYILQAARGLAVAHEQGMVHRDIKPDNLMLNRHGIVKVADLGIVKTPGAAEADRPAEERSAPRKINPSAPTQVTMAGIAMGTPAYMAPEQARDAAKVDARADIYSLGCTLYVLVTGRPPFEGKTAVEVITKHASQPIVPPEVIVKRVPKALSEIILKMVAKRAEDRYQTMPELIKALEKFLGVESSGPFSPREEHAQTLDEAVAAFRAVPAARLRPKLILAFLAATLCVALISLTFSWTWAGGFFGLVLLTSVAYFVLAGASQKSYLFTKVRELIFGSGWKDWLTWIVAGLLLFVVLYLFGWLWMWIAGCVLAVVLAAGFHYTIDARIASRRSEPLEKVQRMLRSMRLKGLEEDSLRQFVCKYAGDYWEEFYEALFGYEAKLAARDRWPHGDRGAARAKYGAWRDPLVRWIEARQVARREAKERRHLQAVEEKGLKAAGVDPAQARKQAEEAASKMLTQAKTKRSGLARTLVVAPIKGPLELVFGAQARFIVGAALVVGCALWIKQNVSPEEFEQAAAQMQEGAQKEAVAAQAKEVASSMFKRMRSAKPLKIAVLPGFLTEPASHFTAGLAGLLLILSAFCASRLKVIVLLVMAGGLFAAHWFSLAW